MIDSRERIVIAGALVLGIAIGVLDARSSEVQGAVLLLLVSGAGLGWSTPRRALRAGVTLGLGVSIVQAVYRLADLPLAYPTNGYAGSFLALVPALIGAVIGRRIGRSTGAARTTRA